ncbi:Na+/H+ antiporter [Actinorhabdospora filicis]|uniref:Na+/H+ antiporter n=1 Tax=Actinorhabdospora filicis TaxID=1785913 RepID=A0A9W6SI90_9ACTN|nr:Na+/H+ antiporter [Actinorhabdospora filicis]GLZ76483.1 Na+/H+ antiporter [Actinorhabdospora filicis]
MSQYLTVLGIVIVVIAVYAASRRLGILAPIPLMIVGVILGLTPWIATPALDPDLILFGILPPLLFVAAQEFSVPAFRLHMRPILLLAVGLVIFTSLAVGFALHAVMPSIPLSAALALGAVVGPPDAVSAIAVARRLGLPRKLVTILEGESLLNDATALVLLRVAVAAAVGEAVGIGGIALTAVQSAGGGLLVGLVAAVVMTFLHRRTLYPLLDNALSLITPFVAYYAAELIHGSGVVAVVVTGLYVGHRLPTMMSAASRLQMAAFWKMVVFMLEGAVFVLVGMHVNFIVHDLTEPIEVIVGLSALVVGIVIAARFVWIIPAFYTTRLFPSRERDRDSLVQPIVLSWAGMRGAITLAAALTLPLYLSDGSTPFPHRTLLIWLAFVTIVVTLLLQGTTLPVLVRKLKIKRDDSKADALAEASVQHEATRAALVRLEQEITEHPAPTEVVQRLRQGAQIRANHAWERLGPADVETPSDAFRRLRHAMLDTERGVFVSARDEGRIPDEVLTRVQRDMDLEESLLGREHG